MVFITLLAFAATAAAAYQQAQSAKASDDYSQMMVDRNNKAAMENYRTNLVKFAERRVEKRKLSLSVQADVASQYISVQNEFAGTYADNWGASAEAYARNIARRAGEDREQVEQNLQRELEVVNDAQEQARLDLTTQLQAAPPETSKAALISGLLNVGFAAAALPSNITIAQENAKIQRSKLNKLTDTATPRLPARQKPTGAGVIVAGGK